MIALRISSPKRSHSTSSQTVIAPSHSQKRSHCHIPKNDRTSQTPLKTIALSHLTSLNSDRPPQIIQQRSHLSTSPKSDRTFSNPFKQRDCSLILKKSVKTKCLIINMTMFPIALKCFIRVIRKKLSLLVLRFNIL